MPCSISPTLQRSYSLEKCYADLGLGSSAATCDVGRSFITELASKGVGVRVLAELSEHRSTTTTQRYIDVNDDMLRKAVELV